MNTRLQVEHPVTEWITGLDLVKEQIRIAAGEKLAFTQEDLQIHGHAIELRVCAEDPANRFLPDTGRLESYRLPQGPGVRVDDGYEQGLDIPLFYDPLIAKLIAWGQDREEARGRLVRAIEEYEVKGVRTTLPFGHWAVQQPPFVNGRFDTGFIEKYFSAASLQQPEETAAEAAALLAVQLWDTAKKQRSAPVRSTGDRHWQKRRAL
jgi:acetyl-CoA carboxylase biotin carboxylase subunit